MRPTCDPSSYSASQKATFARQGPQMKTGNAIFLHQERAEDTASPLGPHGRHVKQLRWQMSGVPATRRRGQSRAERSGAEQSGTSAIMPHAAGPSVCVRVCEREREKEQRSLLSQASHYVACNLSFRGPGRSSDCAEWGWSNWPPLSFLCFHSA